MFPSFINNWVSLYFHRCKLNISNVCKMVLRTNRSNILDIVTIIIIIHSYFFKLDNKISLIGIVIVSFFILNLKRVFLHRFIEVRLLDFEKARSHVIISSEAIVIKDLKDYFIADTHIYLHGIIEFWIEVQHNGVGLSDFLPVQFNLHVRITLSTNIERTKILRTEDSKLPSRLTFSIGIWELNLWVIVSQDSLNNWRNKPCTSSFLRVESFSNNRPCVITIARNAAHDGSVAHSVFILGQLESTEFFVRCRID